MYYNSQNITYYEQRIKWKVKIVINNNNNNNNLFVPRVCYNISRLTKSTTLTYNLEMELANHSPNGLSVITMVCHMVQLN